MSKEQEMFALIDEFESSDLNGRDFCQEKRPVPSTLYYWKKKKARREAPKSGFIAIFLRIYQAGSQQLIFSNGSRYDWMPHRLQ